MEKLEIIPLRAEEELVPGSDLASWIAEHFSLEDGDVVVVSSKVVSKAEGHLVRAEEVAPSAFAHTLAERTGRTPAYCEVVLRESQDIVRMGAGVVICRTHQGFVLANAGVDASNCDAGIYAVLPPAPDASAEHIRRGLLERTGCRVAVILSDTFGRTWRVGQTDLAIGVAGMRPLRDYRGTEDRQGRQLTQTLIAEADELASAAELVRGKANGTFAVVIRGYAPTGEGTAVEMLMPPERDLFR